MTITADNWKNNADGDWSTAANWTLGTVPNSNNTVTISTPSVHTVTHSGGADVVDQLTVGSTDHFVFSGGSLEILTTASFADGYTQTGGTLVAGAVTITGPGTLIGGAAEGSTAFTVKGAIALANYTLGGSTVLNNAATTNQTGQVTLGDNTGVNAKISNVSGALYNVAGDFGITGGAASATLVNAGTLEKSAGAGTSVIGVNLTSTGAITAVSGNLEFEGPTNTISGNLAGGGQVSFGAGVTTLGSVTDTLGALGLYGAATLVLGANLSNPGSFTDSSDGNSTLSLGAHTMTLAAASNAIAGNFGSALVTGSGVLANQGTLTLSNAVLGGTVTLSNTKVIDQTGQVTAGDGGGSAPTITNAGGATYDFTTDSNLSESGATVAFTNQGLLEKTGTGGASVISLAVTSSGVISGQSGALVFSNTLINSGAINGAASVEITGVATLNSGTGLNVANFDVLGAATLNLGTSLSYAGVFDNNSDGNTTINLAGHGLTLSGATNAILGAFGNAFIGGGGTLANTGTLALGNAVIDATTTLSNAKTINQVATVQIGGVGGQVASVVNAAAGVYNLTGAFLIGAGASTASHFDNAGQFNVTAGIGVATIATTFSNLTGGVINVVSGALRSTGTLVDASSITGAKLILDGASQTQLNRGTALFVKEIDVLATSTITLGASIYYAGTFVDASDGNTVLNLGALSMELGGASEFASSFGSDIITGASTLKLIHSSLFEGQNTLIGGTVKLEIDAAVTATGNLQVGDSSANAASVLIDSAGVYDLTTDTGVSRGSSAASTITNSGLFEKTAGLGTSVEAVAFVNNGVITVTSGTLEFLKGTLTNKGTINGTQTTDQNGNILITKAASVSSALVGYTPASPQRFVQAAAGFGSDFGGPGLFAGRSQVAFSPMLARPQATHAAEA